MKSMALQRNVILMAVILTMALPSGCGKTDGMPMQELAGQKISGEQPGEGLQETQQVQDAESESQQAQGTAPESRQEQDVIPEFGLEELSDRVFYFSSGVGGWYTELFINGDGSFKGHFQDSDMGDNGGAYPGGTLYYCDFTGMFEDLEKVDDFTCKMHLASLAFAQEPGKEEIVDGIRYVYSTAYGLDDGGDFYLYLPGAEVAALPEGYLQWVHGYGLENTAETGLSFYGLYNINTGDGFSSSVYEERSLSEQIGMEISFAEERSAELEAKLQEDATQLDMNMTSEELFRTWDDTLNIVWKLLVAELDSTAAETLKTEERDWITFKEAEVEAAGQEYGDGSIQPMVKFLKAAELTKERVYELEEYALTL